MQPTVYATAAIVMCAVGCTVGSAHDTDDHRAKSAHETDDRDQMTTCRDNCVIVNLTLYEPEPEAEPRARAIDLERE